MHIVVQRRAEIALRSLGKLEQKQITRALAELSAANRTRLNRKLHSLAKSLSDKKLFVYRASPKLRLILSFEGDVCTIEDVVDHDRLDRLSVKRAQE
jgi:hypothetical protein